MVYTWWEHDAFHFGEWPAELRTAYLKDPPVFDPGLSEASRENGRIPERVRTWPGARRSAHPLASVAALGRDTEWIVRDHTLEDAYGDSSPFARLVERRGQVLLLGAPLETLTILYHAEAIARVHQKRHVRFPARIRTTDGVVDVEIDDIDSSRGAFDYDSVSSSELGAFEIIAREALAAGVGTRMRVANAESHLFDAAPLVTFATTWMEQRFNRH
jgi:aminoglycoside 3-N-acetyltransferase